MRAADSFPTQYAPRNAIRFVAPAQRNHRLDLVEPFHRFASTTGTPLYMSPEVMMTMPYSKASDVWSLGCVLYEMAARKTAFDACGLAQLVSKACWGSGRLLLVVECLRTAHLDLPSASCRRPDGSDARTGPPPLPAPALTPLVFGGRVRARRNRISLRPMTRRW